MKGSSQTDEPAGTKATERIPKDQRGFPLSAYCCTPLQPAVTFANQPKTFVASERLALPELLLREWRVKWRGILGSKLEGGV
jgi:hypothetical protein